MMAAYFSDLQSDGTRRWYNIVADRHWELMQASKTYKVKILTAAGKSHIEITPRQRTTKKYLEQKTGKSLSKHEGVVKDAAAVNNASSDFKDVRRVTAAEREGTEKAIPERDVRPNHTGVLRY